MSDKKYYSIVLNKTVAWQKLKSGDPWTLIEDEPILIDGVPVAVGGFVSRWFSTAETGRIFRVDKIHKESVYETTFIGFHHFMTANHPDAYSHVVDTNGKAVNLPGLKPPRQVPKQFQFLK